MYWPKISLIIPCYNEASRLHLLFEGLEEFASRWGNTCEYILVDDGSTDTSVSDIKSHPFFASGHYNARLLSQENTGKGGALKKGVMLAEGEYILTLDADMAAKPTDLLLWFEKKRGFSKKEILIGSRELKNSKVADLGYRKVIGNIFNFIIRTLTGLKLNDTQCGFKLYSNEAGKQLFSPLQTLGWAHDVEILKRANRLGYAITEMPVNWVAVPGSKINVLRDSWTMFWEVMKIRKMKMD
jgi:dolichyl-phosphate beta-glucosyltransferase